jgi:hypothetical protein
MPIIDYIYSTVLGLLQIEAIQWTIGLFIVFYIIGRLDQFNSKLKQRYKFVGVFWDWFYIIFWWFIVLAAIVFFLMFIYFLFNEGKLF